MFVAPQVSFSGYDGGLAMTDHSLRHCCAVDCMRRDVLFVASDASLHER